MRALILGSEGQIGAHLSNYLLDHGWGVAGIDIENDPNCDLRGTEDSDPWMEVAFSDADIVYFLAFDVGGSEYLKDYQNSYEFIDNNTRLMQHTFHLLKKTETPFVFASSQMSNMNHSSYGVLKRLGEFYTRSLGGINVKFWNVYGIEHDPKKFHVITDFINMARRGEIRMRTDGLEQRQFLYADDCSKALAILGKKYQVIDHTIDYDVTSYEWVSVGEIARTVQKVVNPDATIVPGTGTDTVQGVRNEPNRSMIGMWHVDTELEDGIRKVANGML